MLINVDNRIIRKFLIFRVYCSADHLRADANSLRKKSGLYFIAYISLYLLQITVKSMSFKYIAAVYFWEHPPWPCLSFTIHSVFLQVHMHWIKALVWVTFIDNIPDCILFFSSAAISFDTESTSEESGSDDRDESSESDGSDYAVQGSQGFTDHASQKPKQKRGQ